MIGTIARTPTAGPAPHGRPPGKARRPIRAMLARARGWTLAHGRAAIYALLLAVVGSGITLSVVMERTAAHINGVSGPLFEEEIPLLRQLNDFDNAVQRYQLTLNEYRADSITRERFVELEAGTREKMASTLAELSRHLGTGADLAPLRLTCRHLAGLIPRFAQQIEAMPPNLKGQLIVLCNIDRDLIQIRMRILELGAVSRDGIAANTARTESDVAGMTRLAHMFDMLALLTAVFMIYHVKRRFHSEDQLAGLAGHDRLTGLPDRRAFEGRLHRLPAYPHTIVLGTLDRFSSVIGGYGHSFGDRMIESLVRRIDIAAREHGGEAFRLDGANIAILYKMAQHEARFGTAVRSLQQDVRTPFSCEDHEVFSSLSLGAARFPDHGTTASTLLRNADAALRAARQAGGDQLIAYSEQLNATAQRRLDLESGLRHAISRGEIELYYQPQQSQTGDRLIGFEALLRWRHNGEQISPAEFIPLAEESGQIIALGEWVLRQACIQLSRWQSQGMDALTVAINISPRQFRHRDFLLNLEQVLASTGALPANIELEITEGVMVEHAEKVIDLLHQLRGLGLKLSIDDFGTGYSSLAYLKRFPINKLKIDQSFVRHLGADSQDAAIVQAVISLGHNLGIDVIAEGVESEAQRELLRHWGCDEIQGYFYGRPMPADAAADFIRACQPAQARVRPTAPGLA
jgi:diguanylate cyclase (GGDEF)-like protein